MYTIRSYSDLKEYLKNNPLRLCWFGPRSSDISGLEEFLSLEGSISCYGGVEPLANEGLLSYEKIGWRGRYSVDDLPEYLLKNGVLYDFCKRRNVKSILPYDSNVLLEQFCVDNNIDFYSKPDALKEWFRDKTNIDTVSKEIGLQTIPGLPGVIDTFEFEPMVKDFGTPLFLHFVGGAGGSGNYIVETKEQFDAIKRLQKGRRLNVKKFCQGRSCCVDICVTSSGIMCGPVEEMIIGAEPLNSNPTEYVGSSWFENEYSTEFRIRILNVCMRLGEFLQSKGFVGVFHPDFLIDGDTIFLTELNMRFGGSCGAFAKIQCVLGQVPLQVLGAATFCCPELIFDFVDINNRNLFPLNYAVLIFKNNFGRPITIRKKYSSGLYSYNQSLEQTGIRDIKRLKGSECVYIVGLPESGVDTVVEEGAFICEIITKFPISDTRSKLNPQGKRLAEIFLSQIIE